MSRGDGWQTSDRPVMTLRDPRLIRAVRAAGLAAVVVWDAVWDASWEKGERVSADDAVTVLPFPVRGAAKAQDALVAVGLLGEDGMVREEVWEAHYGPARDARQQNRARWAKAKGYGPEGVSTRTPRGVREDSSASVPPLSAPHRSVPPRPAGGTSQTWDGWDTAWDAFRTSWDGRGFRFPPSPEQREALWDAVSARPNEVARWVAEARKGAKSFEVVAHVLLRWQEAKAAVPPDPKPEVARRTPDPEEVF